jgi:hypothetical protein
MRSSGAGFKGHEWKPFVGIGYGMRGESTNAQMTGNGIDFRVRIPVHQRLKMEVRP